MNNCELYQELISRLVDGELSRNEYAALEAHMENCAECSAMYAVFASLSDIIGGEDEPLPEDLHENIMAGVRRSAMINHNRRRLSKPVRNVLATAACAALVLFAARGLAPEKAADTMLSQSQTTAMDISRMGITSSDVETAEEEAAPAETEPAATGAAPVEVVTPTATPVVNTPAPKDIYLEDENNEAKPATGSTNNYVNYVSPTPKPTPIVVDTPVTVATPRPTPTPNIGTITASPAPAAVVPQTQAPAPVAEAPAQESSQPEATAQQPAAASEENADKVAPAASPEPEIAAAPVETEPAATEAPSFKDRLMAFFSLPRTAAMSAAEPSEAPVEEVAETETPAEEIAPEPVIEASPEPTAAAEKKERKPIVIKLENVEKLTVLENMLDGKEAKLPEAEPDYEFSFTLAEPEEGLEDYEIKVFIFGKTVYYVQIFSADEYCICASPCKLEDFVKYVNGLSDKEKGIDPAVSPAVIWPTAPVEESPAASPEVSEAPVLPAQSPESSEIATEE